MIFYFTFAALILWTHIWSEALPAPAELRPFVLPRGFRKSL